MAGQRLEWGVRSANGLAVIDLRGDINAEAEAALNAAYAQAEGQNTSAILLNFSQAGYINSTGIALLVGLLTRARQSGRKLLACGLSPHYSEIFKITRLADFMPIYPDEASAAKDF